MSGWAFTRPAENWQHRLLRLTPTRHRATNGLLKVRIETRWRGNNRGTTTTKQQQRQKRYEGKDKKTLDSSDLLIETRLCGQFKVNFRLGCLFGGFCKFTTFCNLLRRCHISPSFFAYSSIRWTGGASLRKRMGVSPKAPVC